MPDDIKNHAIGPKGYRNCNLRQRFIRLIKRAGVKPWPNPFNNLREGRQGAPGGPSRMSVYRIRDGRVGSVEWEV